MRIGLFIPCYVDALYPHVGKATYALLSHYGLTIDYPERQTCCGQPMANGGFERMSVDLAKNFDEMFATTMLWPHPPRAQPTSAPTTLAFWARIMNVSWKGRRWTLWNSFTTY